MRIQRRHTLGKDVACSRVRELAAKLEKKFSLSTEWRNDHLAVSGSGVNGRIAVTEDMLDVDMQLAFPVTMMESKIRSAVDAALDEHFC